MPANRPYDPRYNAKLYISKLTEEERRAWATPLESLRRPRTEPTEPASASPSPEPAMAEVATPRAPAPTRVVRRAPQFHTPQGYRSRTFSKRLVAAMNIRRAGSAGGPPASHRRCVDSRIASHRPRAPQLAWSQLPRLPAGASAALRFTGSSLQ